MDRSETGKGLPVEFDERRIDALFADVDQCHRPGAAVGIAIGGRPVYRKGFGLVNMEVPIVLSAATRMPIASTTKHFTCLAYLLHCEDGKARIDDTLGKFLPELPPMMHEITMRQLMSHLSGLRDVYDTKMIFSGSTRETDRAELLSLYHDIRDVNAAPDTVWNYNNAGYLLLGLAIERLSGRPLEDELHERIFEPVGMHDTILRRFDTDFLPNSAALHMTDGQGRFEKAFRAIEGAGQGGITSTVDDMLRWLAHMDAPRVGSAATWEAMKTSQRLPSGVSTGYGLGLMTGPYRGVETLSHPGGLVGGNAQMLKVPAAGLDIAIMVNRADLSSIVLTGRILDACLPGLDPVDIVFKGPFAQGTFRSPKTGRVLQLYAKDEQQFVSIDGGDLQVIPDAEGVLRPLPAFGFFKQEVRLIGDAKSPAAVRFSDFGTVDDLVAVKIGVKDDAELIEGRYRSDSTGDEVIVSSPEDGRRLITMGRFGSATYELERLADDVWRAKSPNPAWPWGGILSFSCKAKEFLFSSPRTRSLHFHRIG